MGPNPPGRPPLGEDLPLQAHSCWRAEARNPGSSRAARYRSDDSDSGSLMASKRPPRRSSELELVEHRDDAATPTQPVVRSEADPTANNAVANARSPSLEGELIEPN